MRPVNQIPDSVTVTNTTAEPLTLDPSMVILAGEQKVIDITLLHANFHEGRSPRSRVWQALVGAVDGGQLTLDASTPAVVIGDIDRKAGGTVAPDAASLRPGLPGYMPTKAGGPMLVSITVGAGSAYVDLVFNQGVYGDETAQSGVLAAAIALAFDQGAGAATDCVISSVKQDDNAAEGSASDLVGGETTVRAFLAVTGAQDGGETITVNAVAGAVFGVSGDTAPAIAKTANLVA